MTQIFSKSTFSFDDVLLAHEDIIPPVSEGYFGILELQAIPTTVSIVEHEVICVVDQSGSMSDLCKDDRTKMQHIAHTLKNIIHYFAEHPLINANVSIYSFDDNFYTILERAKITEDNLHKILHKIDKIRPSGNTNIENALSKVGDIIQEITAKHPAHIVSHIFMTDGEATIGSKDKNQLQTLVNTSIQNAFIGFGIDHDAHVLNLLGSHPKSGYYFIDALENSGLVYGEILHSILYKLLTDVTIEVQNGFIYDYKTNTWVQSLAVGDIAGEANKIYQIISNVPDECTVFVEGKQDGEGVRLSADKLLKNDINFMKYIYRQRTLQLLYEGNEIQGNKNTVQYNFINEWNEDKNYSETTKNFKKKLRAFLDELKTYMEQNDLQEDKFIKNLCDDVYICYSTIGTKYGAMFTTARQTSQGSQRCYTVTQIPDDDYTIDNNVILNNLFYPIGMFRPNVVNNNINLDTDEPLLHNISDVNDAPYLTPTASDLMYEISIGRGYDTD
jgi:hypothetical protein